MRAAVVVVAVVVGVAGAAGAARAQAPDEAAREAARAEFRAAASAFAEDDYEAALARYKHAFELAPHDAVRFNVAVCLERLGRFREAGAEYAAAAESAELDGPARERARELQARVRERLGVLVVAGDVGARARIDDAIECAVPCREEVDPGAHRVALVGASVSREVSVDRGAEATVELRASEVPIVPATSRATSPPTRGEDGASGSSGGPGALAWIGTACFVLGGAAAVVGGVRASELEAQYHDMPSANVRDEGLAMTAMFHAGLGLAALGGLFVLIDALTE